VEEGCKEFEKLNKRLEREEKILEDEKTELEEAKVIKEEKQDKVDSLKQRLAELNRLKEVRKEKEVLVKEMEEFRKNMHSMPSDVSNKTEQMKEIDKQRRLTEIKVNVGEIKSDISKSEDNKVEQAEKVYEANKSTRECKGKPMQAGDQSPPKLDYLNRKNKPQFKFEHKKNKVPCKSSKPGIPFEPGLPSRRVTPSKPSRPSESEELLKATESASQEAATPAMEGYMVILGLSELASLEWAPVQGARGDEAALLSAFLQAAGVLVVQEGRAGRQEEELRLAFSSTRLEAALEAHCQGASRSLPSIRAGLPRRVRFRPSFPIDLYPLILRGRSAVGEELAGHEVARVEEVIESVHRASFAGLGSLLRCFADPRLVARFPGGNMAIARGAVARVVSNQGLVCLTEEQLCSVNFLAEGINGCGYARAITLILRHTKVKEVVIDANDEFKVIFSNEEDLEVICREFFDPSFDSMESLERAGRRSCLVTRRDKGRAQGKFFILLTTSQDRLELRDFSKFIGGTRTVVVEEGKVLVSTKQLLVDILTDQAVVAKYPSLQLVNSNFWFKSDRGKWRPRQKAEGS